LSRSPNKRKVPSSKLGGKSLLFKAVVCLETTFKLSPLSKISSVPNGSRASVICFHSVVVVTFASHAKGPQFETGWKQSLVEGCDLSWHKSLTRPTFQDLFSSKRGKGQCYLFPYCSGYHVYFTRERSPVRNWVETVSCLRLWSVLAQVPHKTHFPRSLQFQTGQGPVLSVSIV